MTIPQALSEAARKHGGRPALVGPGIALSHAQLETCVAGAASALETQGVASGDVIGISMQTSPLQLVTILALARAGACSVHVFPEHPPAIKQALCAQLGIAALVGEAGAPGALRADPAWLKPAAGAARPSRATADAPWRIALSSGTTGLQKATVVTHAAMVADLGSGALTTPVDASDSFLCHRGLDAAWTLNWVLALLVAGGSIVFPASRSIRHFLDAMKRHAATRLIMAPVFLSDLVSELRPGSGGLPTVRSLLVGGGPSSPDLIKAALERVTPNLATGYGATELGLITYADAALMRRAPSSVGFVQPGFEAEVVDDTGARLPAGRQGILRCRRKDMPSEYFRHPEATARAFRDGWFYAGDVAFFDDEGLLYLEGRVDDEINIGGAKVVPGPVERALQEHPSVAEAIVFAAAPDGGPGALFAAATLRAPVEEKVLIAHCRSLVGGLFTPVRIFFVKEFPRNDAGKVLRAELARRVARPKPSP